MRVVGEDEPDKFSWHLTNSGRFTVKYMYEDLINGHMPFIWNYLWKLKYTENKDFYVVLIAGGEELGGTPSEGGIVASSSFSSLNKPRFIEPVGL